MHITNAGQRYYAAASKLVRARSLHCVQVALNCHILEIQDEKKCSVDNSTASSIDLLCQPCRRDRKSLNVRRIAN